MIVEHLLTEASVWQSYNRTSENRSTNKVFNIMQSVADIMNTKVETEYQFRNGSLFSRTERFNISADSSLTFNITHDYPLPVELVVPFRSLNFTSLPVDVSATFSAILKTPKSSFLDVDYEKVNSNIFALVLERNSFLVDEFYFR